MKYKVLVFASHDDINPSDDNIDINVVLSNGDVYFATLFTADNIVQLLKNAEGGYVYAVHMIIVKDLTVASIKEVVTNIIQEKRINSAMSKIGTIAQVGPDANSFDDVTKFVLCQGSTD